MIFTFKKTKSFTATVALIVSGVIALLVLNFTGTHVVFGGKTIRKLPIYSVEREDKKIAISFDCAWGTDYTDKLLEIMQGENVKCTFFTVEFWAKKHPDYLKKISEYGHEIGTHSATHPYMSKLDREGIIRELSSSVSIIESVTGNKVKVFRPPYGDYNDRLIETASEMGLYTIQWDVDSLDWKDLSAFEIEKRVVSRVKSGSIVLFHNQGLHTAEALPQIIKTLKNKGFEFTTIGDLIYQDDYYMSADGRQYKNS